MKSKKTEVSMEALKLFDMVSLTPDFCDRRTMSAFTDRLLMTGKVSAGGCTIKIECDLFDQEAIRAALGKAGAAMNEICSFYERKEEDE